VKEFIVAFAILALLAVFILSPASPERAISATPAPTLEPTPMGNATIGGMIDRYVDYEAGVVCYKASTSHGVSMYCFSISQTNLESK
jgi:thiamine transporter ThiT